jgi:hypothetical protein
MPWKTMDVREQRVRFVVAALRGEQSAGGPFKPDFGLSGVQELPANPTGLHPRPLTAASQPSIGNKRGCPVSARFWQMRDHAQRPLFTGSRQPEIEKRPPASRLVAPPLSLPPLEGQGGTPTAPAHQRPCASRTREKSGASPPR